MPEEKSLYLEKVIPLKVTITEIEFPGECYVCKLDIEEDFVSVKVEGSDVLHLTVCCSCWEGHNKQFLQLIDGYRSFENKDMANTRPIVTKK